MSIVVRCQCEFGIGWRITEPFVFLSDLYRCIGDRLTGFRIRDDKADFEISAADPFGAGAKFDDRDRRDEEHRHHSEKEKLFRELSIHDTGHAPARFSKLVALTGRPRVL